MWLSEDNEIECYYECSSLGYFGADSDSGGYCRCHNKGFGELTSTWHKKTAWVIEPCSANNTYLDVLSEVDYPIDIVQEDFLQLNSTAIGDAFGKNRFGGYGALCATVGEKMTIADVICKQNGFTSAIGYSEGSLFTFGKSQNTQAAFAYSECLGKFSLISITFFSFQQLQYFLYR